MTKTYTTAELVEIDRLHNDALGDNETDLLRLYRLHGIADGKEFAAYMMPDEFASYLQRIADHLPTVQGVTHVYRCSKHSATLVEVF